MSLGVASLQCQSVLDPRLNIDSIRRYNIFRGGKNISWKPVTSTSFSSSSIQITAPPPNPAIIVDREIYLLTSARLTFAGVKLANTPLLQVGVSDALRAYPLSNGIIQTLQTTINNTSVSINMSDVIEPMLRYNVPETKRGKIFSMSPSMQDQYQEYAFHSSSTTNISNIYGGVNSWATSTMSGSARNALGGYGAISGDEMGRGGFSSLIVVSDTRTGTAGAAVVDVLLCEPLFLSPLLFGGEGPGFIGVQTMDFNFTLSNLERMWSRYDAYDATPVPTNYISTINVTLGTGVFAKAPTLLFNYITPGELMPIHREYVYPYFNIDRYPTAAISVAGTNLTSLGAPAYTSVAVESNNIQLQSIPRRIYVFAREQNQDRLLVTNIAPVFPNVNGTSTSAQVFTGPWGRSDSYAVINKIVLNYNNNAGLLSSASQQDLYRMAVNNGCQLSWNQFSNEVGSVLALDFGKDIQLGDLEAPGKLMTSQLQMTVTIQNNSPITKNYTLYVIVVSEGTFTIVDNRCITQIGVVSENDIFEASKSQEHAPYTTIENIYGGDFFSGLKQMVKNGGHKLVDYGVEAGEKAILADRVPAVKIRG